MFHKVILTFLYATPVVLILTVLLLYYLLKMDSQTNFNTSKFLNPDKTSDIKDDWEPLVYFDITSDRETESTIRTMLAFYSLYDHDAKAYYLSSRLGKYYDSKQPLNRYQPLTSGITLPYENMFHLLVNTIPHNSWGRVSVGDSDCRLDVYFNQESNWASIISRNYHESMDLNSDELKLLRDNAHVFYLLQQFVEPLWDASTRRRQNLTLDDFLSFYLGNILDESVFQGDELFKESPHLFDLPLFFRQFCRAFSMSERGTDALAEWQGMRPTYDMIERMRHTNERRDLEWLTDFIIKHLRYDHMLHFGSEYENLTPKEENPHGYAQENHEFDAKDKGYASYNKYLHGLNFYDSEDLAINQIVHKKYPTDIMPFKREMTRSYMSKEIADARYEIKVEQIKEIIGKVISKNDEGW